MKHVRYIGPVPRVVVVPALRLDDVKVGDVIDVEDHEAEVLCRQDCWELAEPSVNSRASLAELLDAAAGMGLSTEGLKTKKAVMAAIEAHQAETAATADTTADAPASNDTPEEG